METLASTEGVHRLSRLIVVCIHRIGHAGVDYACARKR